MPRDDEESGPGGKVAAAVRSVGHGASGGHNRGAGRVPAPRSAFSHMHQKNWDDTPRGGDVSDYVFHEFPKHVTIDGKLFVCNSEAEEDAARCTGQVVRDEDERKRLMALAGIKNVQVDGRWSVAKMSKAIADANHDPSANPFE